MINLTRKRGNGEGSITKRKDGLWMASVTVNYNSETGKVKRNYFYGKSRKEVQEKLTEALHNIKSGTFVEPNKTTVAQWLDTWLYEYKKPIVRQTTFESYEVMVRVHLKPLIGHLKLKDLRPDNLQRLYNQKLNRGRADGRGGLSPRTVRYIHTVLNEALEQAVKNSLLIRNVCTAVSPPPEKAKNNINPLNIEQVNILLKEIKSNRLYTAILLDIGTGLRRGELLALRWQDVDLKNNLLTVKQSLVRVKCSC